MDDITLRQVEPHESELIFSFLAIAARMEDSNEPLQKVLADPALTKYWKGWGREGDLGVVAESGDAGFPIACAWVRRFNRGNAGYGYVADDIPELGLGTVQEFRNRGAGSRALERLIELCRDRFAGISLSVRADNPAVRLYERFGFEPLPDSDGSNRVGSHSITMLLRFGRS